MHQSHLTSAFFAIILTTRVAAQIPHLKARTVPGYHFPVPTGLVERQIIDPDTCSNQWTRFCTLCDVLEDCNYSVITLTCNCAWDKPPSIPDPDPDPDPTPITTTKTPPKPSPDPTPTTTNINGFPPLPFPDHPDGGGDPFPVITVVGGKTFTGTFSVTTIEKYKSLRSKTTIATKTANNGKETDISVTIYPGGISWWPSKQSGPNGDPIPPISEPKEKPTSGTPDDDKSCDPQPKCKDCGSSDSLCKSGDKSGCPCEQGEDEDGKECPSEPPMCKDCGSGDKDSDLTICPSGDNKDCPCKKEEKQCPLEPPTCKANDCGGDENILKCSKEEVKDCRCCPEKIDCPADDCAGDKDRKCTTDKLKSCKCEGSHGDAVPVHVEPSRPLPNQADIDALAWDIFQDLFQGDEKLLNPDEEVPQEPQNPPSSTPTKIFFIHLHYIWSTLPEDTHWVVTEGSNSDANANINICEKSRIYIAEAPHLSNPDSQTPDGPWKFQAFGEDCEFKNDSNSPAGSTKCGGMTDFVECKLGNKEQLRCDAETGGIWGDFYSELARCEY